MIETVVKDFGIQPVYLAAQVVNILILFLILKRYMYKPILKVLEERKAGVLKNRQITEELAVKQVEVEDQYEQMITQARLEAKGIVTYAKNQADEIIQGAISKAEAETESMKHKAQLAIELEKEKAQIEISQNISDLVVLGIGQLTGKVLKDEDQIKFLNDALKQLKASEIDSDAQANL